MSPYRIAGVGRSTALSADGGWLSFRGRKQTLAVPMKENTWSKAGRETGGLGEITVAPMGRPALERRVEDDMLNNSAAAAEIRSVLEAVQEPRGDGFA